MFEEYLPGTNFLKSPRDRSDSLSSTNGRTRLISNISISDNFDDFAKMFNPKDLFDYYSSEESDRQIIPDDVATQAAMKEKRCYHCASLCEVWKRKWKYVEIILYDSPIFRCTNKECNRWNGALETSNSKKPHPLYNTYTG